MDPGVIAFLVKSTQEVFETMLTSNAEPQAVIEGDALRPKSNVVATVGFTGSANGLVAFYSTSTTACEITARLLGMSPDEVNGEVADAIGEVANMIAGSFRSKMVVAGSQCSITVPSVTIGSDFYTKYVSDVKRVLCPFKTDRGEIFVELIVTRAQ
jgi:chemotaxis protein CheX